jgi:hypothetical protein
MAIGMFQAAGPEGALRMRVFRLGAAFTPAFQAA